MRLASIHQYLPSFLISLKDKFSPPPEPSVPDARPKIQEMPRPFLVERSAPPLSPAEAEIRTACDHLRESLRLEHATVEDPERLGLTKAPLVTKLRLMWRSPFAPSSDPHDAVLHLETERATAELIRAENAFNNSERIRNEARSAVRAREPQPQPPTPIIIAGVLGFATLFAFTFAELPMAREIEDTEARFLIVSMMGIVFSVLMVFSTFQVRVHSETASVVWAKETLNSMSWNAVAGTGLIASLALLRIALTTGWQEAVLSIGLAGVEACLWAYMKAAAARSRAVEDKFDRQHDGDAQRELDAALCEQAMQEDFARLQQARSTLEALRAQRAARDLLAFDLDKMTEFAQAELAKTFVETIAANRTSRNFRKSALEGFAA